MFSSVQVNYGEYEENKIGGRIGIRWHPARAGDKYPVADAGWERDAEGKPWWGEIKLSMTYNVKTKKFEWEAHVRCEWDHADDWQTSQEQVDRELNRLIKEDPAGWSPKYYAPSAVQALEVVEALEKKVVIKKTTKEEAIKEIKKEIKERYKKKSNA